MAFHSPDTASPLPGSVPGAHAPLPRPTSVPHSRLAKGIGSPEWRHKVPDPALAHYRLSATNLPDEPRKEIRSWNLHLRSDKGIEDLSRMFNPIIRGWLQYYGRFYRSALYPPMRQLDRSLARWADRKYKKLRRHLRRATHWVARISRRDPKLWAHWQMGVRRGSMAGAV